MRIFHTRKVTIFSAMCVPHTMRSHSTRRCTPLRQTPSHSLPPNYRKRPAPFLRQFPVFDQNSACFSSSSAPRLTPLHNLRPTRARTHARQQLFFFCLHSFTRRAQFIHSQRIKCEGFCGFTFTAFLGFAPPPWSADWSKRSRRERSEGKGEGLQSSLLHPQQTESQALAELINSIIQIKNLHT